MSTIAYDVVYAALIMVDLQGLREERHPPHRQGSGDIPALAHRAANANVRGGRGFHREVLPALVGRAYPVLPLSDVQRVT